MPSHLTIQERDSIAQLRHQGAEQQEIAQALGRAPSTISRELRRNSQDDVYHAAQAQYESERRRRERPLVRKMDDPHIHEAVRSKHADHVQQKLKRRLKELDAEHRRSITFDNGTEFARCQRLEKQLDMTLYFADPGCPYQRGTNENTNGLIRQYFPKGTDFRDISHDAVRRVQQSLNNRPRACLGFQTPSEVFFEKSPPTSCD